MAAVAGLRSYRSRPLHCLRGLGGRRSRPGRSSRLPVHADLGPRRICGRCASSGHSRGRASVLRAVLRHRSRARRCACESPARHRSEGPRWGHRCVAGRHDLLANLRTRARRWRRGPRNLIRLLGLRKSLAGTPFALRPTLQDLAEDRNVAGMKEWLVTHALERAYESQTSWEYAAQRGYVDVLSRQWAALKGQIPTNVNARALVAAIRYSRADAVPFLLAHGADPSWRSGCFGAAVVEAARTPALLRLLIEHDADPRRANCVGTTPLMLAAQRGSEA